MPAPSQGSGFYQILASVDNVKHIFVHLQRARTNVVTENPYLFETYKLNAAENKQLLDEVEHDIMNYQNRGLSYLPKPKEDNTDTRF